MRLIFIVFLLLSASAASAAPSLVECGEGAVLSGPRVGSPPSDDAGIITTGTGDPSSCVLMFEQVRPRVCAVRWKVQVPYMPQGATIVTPESIIMEQTPRSNASISYACLTPPVLQ
jgi:hypothetical protein